MDSLSRRGCSEALLTASGNVETLLPALLSRTLRDLVLPDGEEGGIPPSSPPPPTCSAIDYPEMPSALWRLVLLMELLTSSDSRTRSVRFHEDLV